MVKKLLFLIINIFFLNIWIIPNDLSDDNFNDIVNDYILKGKFYKLINICNSKLNQNPENYIAAYYKAYSMQKTNNKYALNYYLDYIKQNPLMLNNYKEKWLNIALDLFNKKKLKFKENIKKYFVRKIEVNILNDKNEFYTKSKILQDQDNFYYLTENGDLYLIKKILKLTKKINYYKTRDFIILDNYIVFNDSVNLIRYDLNNEKYELIYTFEKDNISFISTNLLINKGILRHQKSDNYLIKQINFETKELKELPDNCISQSNEYLYFVMNYNNKFEIFDLNGNKLLTVIGKFIGFGTNDSEIYYYKDNYLYYSDINYQIIKQIVYLPEYKSFIDFKAVSYNKILFFFDQYIFEYKISNNQIYLSERKIIQIFKNGYMFKENGDNKIYFLNFLNNSIILLFSNIEILNNIVFSDNNSSIFAIKKGNSLIIYNLR